MSVHTNLVGHVFSLWNKLLFGHHFKWSPTDPKRYSRLELSTIWSNNEDNNELMPRVFSDDFHDKSFSAQITFSRFTVFSIIQTKSRVVTNSNQNIGLKIFTYFTNIRNHNLSLLIDPDQFISGNSLIFGCFVSIH